MMQIFPYHKPATVVGKAILFCGSFIILLVGFSLFRLPLPLYAERFVYGVLGTLAALIATYIFIKIDRQSLASIGLTFERKTIGRFLLGFVAGCMLTVIMFSILISLTPFQLKLNSAFRAGEFFWLTLSLIPLALMEEIAFRAYPLVILNRRLGLWPSLIIMAILFALYHIVNGWGVLISFLGPGIWAFIFGIAAIYSRGIALSTGIHFAANFIQAAIGLKKEGVSIWNMQLPQGVITGQKEAMIGYAIQFGLLLLAILFIEGYRRKYRIDNLKLALSHISKPNEYAGAMGEKDHFN